MGMRVVSRGFGFVVLLLVVSGCQSTQPDLGNRLIAHIAMIDFSGLNPSEPITDLNVRAAMPQSWQAVPAQSNALFTHRQWRSASHATGVGVAYIHLPLPMSPKAMLWLAKAKYSGKTADGRLTAEWTDTLGREWFEGANAKYHVRGYAVTSGFDAWVVYTGYRLRGTPDPVELSLAARSMDSVVPLPLLK